MEESKEEINDWWSTIEEAFVATPQERELMAASEPVEKRRSMKEMIERSLKSPHLPKLDPLSSNIVIAAESYPGFSWDLSSWNLTIDRDGNLHQHILIYTPKGKLSSDYREDRINIGVEEVTRLLNLANEIGFPNFEYTETCVTDLGSCRITIFINGQIETVKDDAWPRLTDESEEKFYWLWQEIRQLAPYPQNYICYLSQRPK